MTAFLENFHFLRPWALLLILPALGVWWASQQASDTTRRWRRGIDPELLKHLVVGDRSRRLLQPHHLALAGAFLAILAVAGPTWQREKSPFAEQAAPAMIVLKVAPTMTTTDLAPTRLDRARQKLADLLRLRDGMPAPRTSCCPPHRIGMWFLAWLALCRRRSCLAKATNSPRR